MNMNQIHKNPKKAIIMIFAPGHHFLPTRIFINLILYIGIPLITIGFH